MKRLAGLETEYGCMAPESFGLPAVPTRVRDYVFKKKKLGLIDLHDRDYDEPAGNGGISQSIRDKGLPFVWDLSRIAARLAATGRGKMEQDYALGQPRFARRRRNGIDRCRFAKSAIA